MKVLVNGCLNLSELDGWWAEAYTPEVGWALGDGREHGDVPAWDAAEAEQLYRLLEEEVVPEFYDRDESGIPVKWIQRIRESMARLTHTFSANRCVREYTEKYYVPLASGYKARTANGPTTSADIVHWQNDLREHWGRIRFTGFHVETEGNTHHFNLQVYLDELSPAAVQIELYAEGAPNEPAERHTLGQGEALVAGNTWRYTGQISASRPASDYTPRIVAFHPQASVPLEAAQILWYH
jgi:starch phosphorylase